MNTVYVVTKDSWTGEHDYTSVIKVFTTRKAAEAFVDEKNAAATSAYDSTYDWHEVEVED